MKNYLLISALILLVNCAKENKAENAMIGVQNDSLQNSTDHVKNPPEVTNISNEQNLKNLNDSILKIFRDKNYAELANFIHPEKGVTFSMYGFVDTARSKNFTKQEFLMYLPTSVKFTWGQKDGSGDLLVVSLRDYLQNWVYSRNFSTGVFHLNTFRRTGNTLNNLEKIFPEAEFTENYIAGSEKFSGMDWNALRFVFEKYEGRYYLVAVVNDQWTI